MNQTTVQNHRKNRILERLPEEEMARLLPHLQSVDLKKGDILNEYGATQEFAYFPTDCLISILYHSEDGTSKKVGSIGDEGMVGLVLVLEADSTPAMTLVQFPGQAWRLRTEVLRREFFRGEQLMRELLRYVQYSLVQVSQMSLCAQHHLLEQRLCSWMLFSMDRLQSTTLELTQDEIAAILGMRRQGISEALSRFKAEGIVEYTRGAITVTSVAPLRQRACDCFNLIKAEEKRLFGRLTSNRRAEHTSTALNSSYLRVRARALEMALQGSGLAWWDVNLLTGNNEITDCDLWTGMLGYAPGEFQPDAAQWDSLVHPEDRAVRATARLAHLSGAKPMYECEYRIAHKDGHWVWIAASGTVATRDSDGKPLRMVGTNMDITQRKEAELALQKLVRTDFLTGAATRRQFFEVGEREFSRAQRHGSPLTLLSLDLDHFKAINDAHGHAAGDAVLKRFAQTMFDFLRMTDVFARIGGEEFCLLLPHTEPEGAKILADRILEAVRAQPATFGGLILPYTVSIGLSKLAPSCPDFEALIKYSDEALYTAKTNGRDQVAIADCPA